MPFKIERPIYLSGAPISDDAKNAVVATAKKAAPFGGLVGATLLGVTAAYFAPKFFDWALDKYRLGNEGYNDGTEGDGPTVDLDVEPRDD